MMDGFVLLMIVAFGAIAWLNRRAKLWIGEQNRKDKIKV